MCALNEDSPCRDSQYCSFLIATVMSAEGMAIRYREREVGGGVFLILNVEHYNWTQTDTRLGLVSLGSPMLHSSLQLEGRL